MDKRATIERLLDEFELLVTQYADELGRNADIAPLTSEAIRVTRQRIVDEAAAYDEMRADLINRAEAGDVRASALLVQVDTRCRPRKQYQITDATKGRRLSVSEKATDIELLLQHLQNAQIERLNAYEDLPPSSRAAKQQAWGGYVCFGAAIKMVRLICKYDGPSAMTLWEQSDLKPTLDVVRAAIGE